jgi:hypothetical protein
MKTSEIIWWIYELTINKMVKDKITTIWLTVIISLVISSINPLKIYGINN